MVSDGYLKEKIPFPSTCNVAIMCNNHISSTVLPKFDAKITTGDVVSIEQEEIEAEICAK